MMEETKATLKNGCSSKQWSLTSSASCHYDWKHQVVVQKMIRYSPFNGGEIISFSRSIPEQTWLLDCTVNVLGQYALNDPYVLVHLFAATCMLAEQVNQIRVAKNILH